MRKFLLFCVVVVCSFTGFSQINYTWNGSVSGDWSAPVNWSPNGVPSPTDNIIIVTGSNSCQLGADVSVNNMTLTSGTLNLAGFVLTVNGTNAVYTTGTIQPGSLIIAGATSVSFGNGPLVFNCKTNITSASMIVRNTRFEDSVRLYKTGASSDGNHGNNIFNAPLEVTNAGTGPLLLGTTAADQFNAPSVFNNTGTSNLYVAYSASGHTFNAQATFNSMSSAGGSIYISHNSTSTVFNADIIVNSTSGGGVYFCNGSTSAQATLTGANTIQIGANGFSSGTLWFRQFLQSGTAANNLSLTGNAAFRVGPSAEFNGNLTVETPALQLNGGTFNGTSSFRKFGPTGDWSSGGNIFNGVNSITNSGESYLVLGNSNPDIWNDDVTFTANGGDRLLPAWRTSGNQFNGNIYVNTSDTTKGIQFCGGDTSARAILAPGKTILPGSTGITAGYLYLKQFIQQGSTPLNLTATNTGVIYLGPYSEFSAPVTVTAPNIYCQGNLFHAPVSFLKNGGVNNNNNGYENTFGSTVTIDQQSNSGYFMLGYRTSDKFLDDITVSSSGTGGIYLGSSSQLGWPELAAGKTIKTGTGFSAGFLYLKRFIQNGTAPIQLNFTGNAYLAISDTTQLGGDLITNTPGAFFNGGIFKGKVNATKTGATNDQSQGGNIFLGETTLLNSGTGVWQLAGSRPDSFYAVTHLQSDNTSYLALAWNSPGNYFGDDINVSSSSTSRGVYFGNNTNSSIVLAAGKTVKVENIFDGGILLLKRFRQEGNQPLNLSLTGTADFMAGPLSYFGGDVTVNSPTIFLNGAEYNGMVDFTKTGTSNDNSDGGNIFQSTGSFHNAGAGYFLLGDRFPDTCNADVTFKSSGTERMLIAWSKPGNMFNGNIYVNSTGSSTGIRFCGNTAATATLADGKTIAVGADGFTAGNLQLRQFTQLGNKPVNLTLGSTATNIQYGPGSVFNGEVTSSSPGLYFQGCTFNAKVTSTKTGGNSDYSNGGNIFNDETVITNAGTSSLLLGNVNPDIFNARTEFNNTATGNLYVAHNSAGNIFRGVTTFNNASANNYAIFISNGGTGTLFENDILVNSTSGSGVQFCNGSTGNITLAAGRTISVGAAGFTSGQLLLRQFTQSGTKAQTISMAGGSLTFGPAANFGGAVTTSSAGLTLNGCVFDGTSDFAKTGTSNDNGTGNNLFKGAATFTNTGTGYLALAYTNPDVHQADATYVQTNTGKIYPCYNASASYERNVSVTSPSNAAITFGAGSGSSNFNGSGAQAINVAAGSAVPVFARLSISNTGAGVTLNSNINVSKTLTFNSGLLITSTASILTMLNNAVTTAGNALSVSYVAGPMRCQKSASGVTALNFPVGSNAESRPVILTVNHTNNNLYTYQVQMVKASAKALNYTLPFSIQKVSEIRYYTIDRFNSSMVNAPTTELSGNQGIEIFFGASDVVKDGSKATIVKNVYNAPTSWIDIGGSGAPAFDAGNDLTGSIRSTSSPSSFTSFSTFALGNTVGGMNTLPVTLLDFRAQPGNDGVTLSWSTASEISNSYFTIERSEDAASFRSLQQVPSKAVNGNSASRLDYSSLDANPLPGISYYRLKQTDLNGKVVYSKTVKIDLDSKTVLSAYPNPAYNNISFSGLGSAPQQAQAEWFDASGRNVLRSTLSVAGGKASMNLHLPEGMYMLRITLADGTRHVRQIMIKK